LHWAAVAEPLGKLAALAALAVEVATRALPAALELLGKDFLAVTAMEQAESPIFREEVAVEQQLPESMAFSKVCAVLVAQVQTHFRLGQTLHQLAFLVTMLAEVAAGHRVRLVRY
jgi:hypothetical protein